MHYMMDYVGKCLGEACQGQAMVNEYDSTISLVSSASVYSTRDKCHFSTRLTEDDVKAPGVPSMLLRVKELMKTKADPPTIINVKEIINKKAKRKYCEEILSLDDFAVETGSEVKENNNKKKKVAFPYPSTSPSPSLSPSQSGQQYMDRIDWSKVVTEHNYDDTAVGDVFDIVCEILPRDLSTVVCDYACRSIIDNCSLLVFVLIPYDANKMRLRDSSKYEEYLQRLCPPSSNIEWGREPYEVSRIKWGKHRTTSVYTHQVQLVPLGKWCGSGAISNPYRQAIFLYQDDLPKEQPFLKLRCVLKSLTLTGNHGWFIWRGADLPSIPLL